MQEDETPWIDSKSLDLDRFVQACRAKQLFRFDRAVESTHQRTLHSNKPPVHSLELHSALGPD